MQKALQTVTMERETYAKVKRYAQEKLFHVVKFITSENELRDLESPSSIANHTMDELGILQEDQIAWWAVYKVAVTDGIAEWRNQINMNMKQWVVRKCLLKRGFIKGIMNTNNCCHLALLVAGKTGRNTYSAELVNQDQAVPRHLDLPKLSELLKMHQNPADNDNEDDPENNKEQQAFTFLAEHLLGHVIGKRDDNNEVHGEYPKAMNELEDNVLAQQDSDSENKE
jgi:hypothetical protein